MNDLEKKTETIEKGTWVKYGHLHLYSAFFGFVAGCAVSFLYVTVRVFG